MKLGTCQIHVEPHIFEAQMFAIKDPTPKSATTATPPISQPTYRPVIQYGPPNGVMPPPPPPPPKTIPPPQPIKQVTAKPQDIPMKNSGSPIPPKNLSTGGVPSGRPPNNLQSSAAPNPPQSTSNAKNTDPVIQMLAERAATDPGLKALMRIVANGEATPEELRTFQTHIDDLTRLQKARQAASQPPPSPKQPPPASPATPVSVNGKDKPRPSPSLAANSAPVAKGTPPSQTLYQPQPQALRSKGPVPSTKSEYSGVVFEFTGGSGDRFLFPKFSILDFRTNSEVVVSFLIVRKGSASDSPTYDPKLDYYQPMTIRLYTHQTRQLETLQKVVAHPDEVRRYMDDIMDNMTRAEYVLLAMRLPKDNEEAVDKDDRRRTDQMENQVLWQTTNPTPAPQHVNTAKPVPTEGEQYQSFINSVRE
jgi:hypothetical protein